MNTGVIAFHSCVTIKVTEVAIKDLLSTHCIVHQERLFAKKLSPELSDVMTSVVNVANDIRARVLRRSRHSEALCDSMNLHRHLLF